MRLQLHFIVSQLKSLFTYTILQKEFSVPVKVLFGILWFSIIEYGFSCVRVPLEGAGASLSRVEADAVLLTLYAGSAAPRLATCDSCAGDYTSFITTCPKP